MRSKPKWLRALASTQDAVYVANDAQRIVCWNKGAERLFGFSESDVLNHLCYQVVGGKVCGKSWCHAGCAVQRSAGRGVLLQTLEMQACTRGGQEVWLDVSVFSLERRGRWFTIHVLRDVTREEQRKVALEKVLDTLKAYGVDNGSREDFSNRGLQIYTSGSPPSSVTQLTRREIEVLGLLAEGLSAREVAQRLGVSPFTVRRHIESILLKTGMHTQAQAVAYAYRNGLL